MRELWEMGIWQLLKWHKKIEAFKKPTMRYTHIAWTNHGTCLHPNFAFIFHPTAGPTVHQDRDFQACFPIFCTFCLEIFPLFHICNRHPVVWHEVKGQSYVWLDEFSKWRCIITDKSAVEILMLCSDIIGWATGRASGLWRSWVLVCWWWQFDWSFTRFIAPVVTTASVIFSSSKIQNGDVLLLANPGPSGKMAVETEREGGYPSTAV